MNPHCAVCGADLETAVSLVPIKDVWVCSHPVPKNEACFDRAIERAAKTSAKLIPLAKR